MTRLRTSDRLVALAAAVVLLIGVVTALGRRAPSHAAVPAPPTPTASATPTASPTPAAAVTPAVVEPPPLVRCRVTSRPRQPGEQGLLLRACAADERGRPVRAQVTVAHQQGAAEALFALITAGASATLLCIDNPVCLGGDRTAITRTTGADGQLRLLIPAASPAGQPGSDKVVVSFPGRRVVVETRFGVEVDRDVDLEPLVAWEPRLSLSDEPGGLTVGFSPLPGDAALEALEGDSALRVPVTPGRRLDPHLLPPRATRLLVSTRLQHATYRSAPVAVRPRVAPLPALSGCTLVDESGRERHLRGCGLTDGRWATSDIVRAACGPDELFLDSCAPYLRWVVVDLGGVRRVRDLVAASFCNGVRAQTSTDGRTWSAWGNLVPVDSALVSAPRGVPASVRYVRVGCDNIETITEVSAFA